MKNYLHQLAASLAENSAEKVAVVVLVLNAHQDSELRNKNICA
jgi:hypothetical protein